VPGSSRAVPSRGSSRAGSQQEPILISSDEDITIKMEKSDTAVTSGISEKDEENAVTSAIDEKDESAVTSATNENDRDTKKTVRKKNTTGDKNSRKAISDKAKGKAPVQSSSEDSSSSDSSYSSNSSNTPFYLTKCDMLKDLRESLRVNKDITNFFKSFLVKSW
jgi:hypothetical protein